jgi:DNA-binding response OmpR family regulator
VPLTPLEFDLVDALLRHPSQTLTRDQLLAQTRGPTLDPSSNVIDVYVGYLRRKLGADIIHTVRGVGYRLGA